MCLYKVLIVDDEEEIRLGIIKKIKWEELGFIVIGDAENGQDAIEKAERLQPDVIMTDIKMPYMDGLELAKNLREFMPATKVIIFSGCDDFEYAKQAITFNVIDYVLKPINSIEIIELLKKLKINRDKEINEKRNLETLNRYYIESLPLIREQFLVGAIEGRVLMSDWKVNTEKLNISFYENYFCVAVIKLDYDVLNDSEYSNKDELMFISIKNFVEEILTDSCNHVSFLYLKEVVVIGNLSEINEVTIFINKLNEVSKSFKRIMGLSTSIGVGNIVDSPHKISMSYNFAQSALDYRVILGNEKVIYIQDVEKNIEYNLQFNNEDERMFLNSIKVASENEIKEVIQQIFVNIEKSLLPFNKYRIYLMEIMTSMFKLLYSYNCNIDEIFGEDFNCYDYLSKFNSLSDIKSWFLEKSLKINKFIKSERVHSSMILVEEAKEYIRNNYMDSDISVEKLCSKLHISPAYFSTIFKKETDMSFVNYLTEVRLEEAIKLLNTTDSKTYIIAEKVGYPEANYFSYVFKKKFKVSPSKYRKS